MNTKLTLIIVVVLAVAVAFPILAYMGINTPLPFADWGNQIYSSLSTLGIDKVPLTITTLIGGLGTAIGATGGLTYLYKKTKGALAQTQTALTESTQKVTSLTSSVGSLTSVQETTKSALDKIATEKQLALDQATQLKTQIATMQQNYNSIDAQKAALQNQVADMKNQAIKAQAQLDVLIPKIK
jgi:chromosome segregation ATPase